MGLKKTAISHETPHTSAKKSPNAPNSPDRVMGTSPGNGAEAEPAIGTGESRGFAAVGRGEARERTRKNEE